MANERGILERRALVVLAKSGDFIGTQCSVEDACPSDVAGEAAPAVASAPIRNGRSVAVITSGRVDGRHSAGPGRVGTDWSSLGALNGCDFALPARICTAATSGVDSYGKKTECASKDFHGLPFTNTAVMGP